ncbi:MAG: RidA family protein [Anaerolineaceae bacterium]|nr:RidA family protein [Anaerolineaceae bacterium]
MITRLNPDTLAKNPAFSQIAVVEPPTQLIFVGGQNSVNAAGGIVGEDIASQTRQTLDNVVAALEAAGATLRDVVKMTIYVVQGQNMQDGYAAISRYTELGTDPPTISVIVVAGLANPNFLIEMDAVAAIGVEQTV